ncbi:hypothetical protein GGS24DRAFT_410957 [Hypoxylon argillaceum]|nr:hypothetical protein GGS24DRAFT_410957 [Hypoxylon argillaceum]
MATLSTDDCLTPSDTNGCYEAKPLTPPQSTGSRESYYCILDYRHKPFTITWRGPPEYPDLIGFPALKNVEVASIDQSISIAAIWRDSILLDYGTYASIRTTKQFRFSILKLAHPDKHSIELIQHEFRILEVLSKLGLPIPDVDPQPILDHGTICGYRVRELFKLDLSELRSRSHEIEDALARLHSAGFCHGDISPSNIMKDDGDRIFLIDFSFAGRTGFAVPSCIPGWLYTARIFTVNDDMEAFDRYFR